MYHNRSNTAGKYDICTILETRIIQKNLELFEEQETPG